MMGSEAGLLARVEQAFRPALRRPFANTGLEPLRYYEGQSDSVHSMRLPQRLKPNAIECRPMQGWKPCSTLGNSVHHE
jgi:hypothetical protein